MRYCNMKIPFKVEKYECPQCYKRFYNDIWSIAKHILCSMEEAIKSIIYILFPIKAANKVQARENVTN